MQIYENKIISVPKSLIKNMQTEDIVILGESTHGSLECQEIKIDIANKLIRLYNFDAIILESGPWTAYSIEKSIDHTLSDIREILKSLRNWTICTDTFVQLIQIFKTLKEDRENDHPHIFGVDILESSYLIRKIIRTLERENAGHAQFISRLYSDFKNCQPKEKYYLICREVRRKIRYKLFQARNFLFENYANKNFDFQLLYYWSNQVIRSEYYYSNEPCRSTYAVRDQLMADAIQQLIELKLIKKSIFWTHNAHASIGDGVYGVRPSGWYLVNKHRIKCYSLGFSFYSGYFSAFGVESQSKSPEVHFSGEPIRDSIESNLSSNGSKFIDLSCENIQELSIYREKRYFRSIGALFSPFYSNMYYAKCVLSNEFDAICHFDKISPSRILTDDYYSRGLDRKK